jgi:hypothetical protein
MCKDRTRPPSLPDVDVQMVERIAAGEVEPEEILAWLSARVA